MRGFALPLSVCCAVLTVAFNPFWLEAAFSGDGELAANTRLGLYICQGLLGAACLALFFMRDRRQSARDVMRNAAALAVMGMVVVITLETACFVWNRWNPDLRSARIEAEYHNHVRPHTVLDETLGYKPAPGGHVTTSTWQGKTLLTRATYSTDARGRRFNPRDTGEEKNRAAIFFGCSFTFGSGVEDHETLPSHYSEVAPEYRAYNYGYGAYGPQQTVAKLETGTLPAEIHESDAVAIYTFIDDHVHRAIGSLMTHKQRVEAGMPMPLYALDEDGNVVRKGTYQSARPLIAAAYRVVGWSQAIHAFRVNIPPRLGQRHFRLVSRMIERSRELFQKQFPRGQFFVLFYPGATYANDLIPSLKAAGVHTLDYSRWFDWAEEGMWIPEYAHPTGAAHRRVAERLAIDIGRTVASQADPSVAIGGNGGAGEIPARRCC